MNMLSDVFCVTLISQCTWTTECVQLKIYNQHKGILWSRYEKKEYFLKYILTGHFSRLRRPRRQVLEKLRILGYPYFFTVYRRFWWIKKKVKKMFLQILLGETKVFNYVLIF